MDDISKKIEAFGEKSREYFNQKDTAREKLIPICREVIRHSSQSIRCVHRGDFDDARLKLDKAKELCEAIASFEKDHGDLYNTGFCRDAQKEYAEAAITFAIITCGEIPLYTDLNITPAPYLNGMGETVGELRRYLLDNMRRGDLSRGEDILNAMDAIYGIMVTMDFPDAITLSLRRTTDSVRGILEKTRGDFTLAIQQKNLEQKLERFVKSDD